MAAVEEMANMPLPSLKRPDRKVEVVEEITAKLGARWPTCFCSDERARRWRHPVGNGEAAALLLWSYGRAEEMEMGLVSWLTGALSELKSWPAVQGVRDAWQREQESGDGWHTRAVRCLMTVSHCRSHSDNGNCLTVKLHRFNTAKPLIHCKNRVHENCRPTIHLQLLFKDHRLILHGSKVTSSQSWLDPTKNAVRT